MMQYLTSIPFLGIFKKKSKESRADINFLKNEIVQLKKKIEKQESAIDECAICINQLASTLTTIVTNLSATQSRDPMDEILDNFMKNDDPGTGYLN